MLPGRIPTCPARGLTLDEAKKLNTRDMHLTFNLFTLVLQEMYQLY